MLQIRDLIKYQICWEKKGIAHLWHDNWTGVRNIYSIGEKKLWLDDRYQQVHDLVIERELNVQSVNDIITLEVPNHIFDKIRPPRDGEEKDIPWWMLKASGKFTIKPAWQYIRHKEQPNKIRRYEWKSCISKLHSSCGGYENSKRPWIIKLKNSVMKDHQDIGISQILHMIHYFIYFSTQKLLIWFDLIFLLLQVWIFKVEYEWSNNKVVGSISVAKNEIILSWYAKHQCMETVETKKQ